MSTKRKTDWGSLAYLAVIGFVALVITSAAILVLATWASMLALIWKEL